MHTRPFDSEDPLIGRVLPARAVSIVIYQLFSMEDVRARILGSDGTHCLVCAGSSSCDHDLTPYSGGDDADEWNFADSSVYSHVDVRVSLRHDLDAIPK